MAKESEFKELKKTEYFSHDYQARNDRKMIALRMSMRMEGVGIYWSIVEMLYEEGGMLLLSECEGIAFELKTTLEKVNRVINNFGLFSQDEKSFWSDSVITRLKFRQEKSKKAANSARRRWENNSEMRSHSDGNAAMYANKEKNSIEKNSIEKNSIEKNSIEKNSIEKNSIEKNNAPLRAFEIPFVDGPLKNAWMEWEQHRKEIRKKLTKSTALKQIKFLGSRPEAEAVEIINRSIKEGYTGLFELNKNNNAQAKGTSRTTSAQVGGKDYSAGLRGH